MPTVKEAMRAGLRCQQAGRLEEAKRIYHEVLQVAPRTADAWHLLGVAAHQAGRHAEAVPHLTEAIALKPAEPLFRCSLANALCALGRLNEALLSGREALRLRPDCAEAHLSLGNVFRSAGRMADAEAAFRAAVELQPGNADGHNNLGNVLRSRGRFTAAEACYREALRLRPADPVALANLGGVLVDLGRSDEAEGCLRPALQLRPDLGPAHFSLGKLLHRRGRIEQAEACYREALRLCPDDAEIHSALGNVLRARDDIPAARASFVEAVRLNPDKAGARNDLAACLIEEGRTDEAIGHLQDVLRLNPGFVPALGNLGTLARDGLYQFRDEDVAAVRRLLDEPKLPAEQRSTLSFTLAHVLDKQKSYDEAFHHYRQANDIKWELFQSQGKGFERAQHQRLVEQTLAVGTTDFFRRTETLGSDSELPVFIIGMPRSGTTLVEQILASHPQVHGAGELPDIPNIGERLRGDYPACLTQLDVATVRVLADEHLQRLTRLGGPAVRVIDKLPTNLFHLPLIRLLFPRAAVIHCVRDPLDTCLSCYFQDFYTLSFATRLDDIGFYAQSCARVAEQWRAVCPRLLEVRYEELVAEPETLSRRLVDFCGLDWDERCLAPHENRRVIRTSSVAQVRQPVYRSAVGRWQRYRQHLGPLLEALGQEMTTQLESYSAPFSREPLASAAAPRSPEARG